MEFLCLGPLGVRADGAPVELGGPQQRLVLALLVIHANRVVSTDRLIDSLWGEKPPDTARKTIQGYVSGLRKALPDGELLRSRPPGYALEVELDDVDASRFERLAARGSAQVATNPKEALVLLNEALSLWRGRPYEDLADAEALRPEITRLEQLHAAAIEARIAADLFTGSEAAAATELDDLARRHPLSERLWALRILALYRIGQQAEALRVYDQVRLVLAEEVGLEPGAELRLLQRRILDQDPVLETPSALQSDNAVATTARRNPYKGLRTFGEDDAGDFHGRAALVRRLCEALERSVGPRLLVLVGASGSGKSSVLRAGLMPVLRVRGTDVAILHPGSTTHDQLRTVVDRLGRAQKSVLIVDQLEELFSTTSPVDQSAFLETLAAVAVGSEGPWILVAVRADYLDRVLTAWHLAGLVEPGLVLVTPLEDHEVREIVVGPATRVGVAIEPDLVATAVAQAAHRPSTLPLLEYALADLFDRSDSGVLTLAELRAAGGISGALAKRAEEIYEGLEGTGRETARQLFLHLVALAGDEPQRRRIAINELSGRDDAEKVMAAFADHRLLTFDRASTGEPTVEVAHEALLREWPRLAGWVDQARESINRHRRLAAAAADWEDHDRSDDYLLTGSRLTMFSDPSDVDLAVSHLEEAFLSASQGAEKERFRRDQRRRRLVLLGLATAAAIALVLATIAMLARNDARSQAELAQQESRIADANAARAEQNRLDADAERDRAATEAARAFANELSAAALNAIGEDPELAILLSLHSLATSPDLVVSLDHRTTLRRAMQEDILVAQHSVAPEGDLLAMDLSLDGSALAYWTPGELHLVDTATWGHRWAHADKALLPDPSAPITTGSPVFSPNGQFVAIATTEANPRLLVLDASTGAVARAVELGNSQCGAHTGPRSWSADGRYIGVQVDVDCLGPFGAPSLRILDTTTWEQAVEIPVFGQAVFAEDAPLLAAIEYAAPPVPGHRAVIYDTETFDVLVELGATVGVFHPDGSSFVAVDPDGPTGYALQLYDLATSHPTDRFTGLDDRPQIYAAEFVEFPDGFVIIAGTNGQTTGLWSNEDGRLIRSLPTGAVHSLGYDETEQLLYTAASDGMISVWDFSPGGQASPDDQDLRFWFEMNRFSVNPGSSSGAAVHVGTAGNPIESFAVFDTATGSLRETMIAEIAQRYVVTLPGDRVLFIKGDSSSGSAGPLAVWDSATGDTTDFMGCAASMDDWELGEVGEEACAGRGTTFMPTAPPVCSPDGTELVAMDQTGVVHVWDTATLEEREALDIGAAIGGLARVEAVGSGWLLARRLESDVFVAVDRTTFAIIAEFEFRMADNLEVARDGSFLLMKNLDTSIHRVDTDEWQPLQLVGPSQRVRGLALSPSGDRAMLGGTDGFVHIVDAETGEQLDIVPISWVSDGHWLDGDHIVAGAGSTWTIVTLDFDEVVEHAAAQLSRTFSDEECRIYRLDPCPTLDEIRSLHN
ncbi:MAG: BTAD domain-containing putative transcriptional regulator [Acidimicrobiia bacterium]